MKKCLSIIVVLLGIGFLVFIDYDTTYGTMNNTITEISSSTSEIGFDGSDSASESIKLLKDIDYTLSASYKEFVGSYKVKVFK